MGGVGSITVLGIDPGSRRTGWGIVREESGILSLVACGLITTPTSASGASFSDRLACIYTSLRVVLQTNKADAAAIECVFTAHNPASALKLGQARGVAVAACVASGLPVYDYEATLVKQAITGTGKAEKEQVAFMVGRLLNIKTGQWKADTTDALALAICHLSRSRIERLTRTN